MTGIRDVPHNEMDLQMQLTNPKWGHEVPEELKEKLSAIKGYAKTENGEYVEVKDQLWGLLSFYTRDVRLGNLSTMWGEVEYCRYYLDLANDLLRENYVQSFLTCLSRVATVLELSQSKGGFLRKLINTIRQEHLREEREPKKRNIFGGKSED